MDIFVCQTLKIDKNIKLFKTFSQKPQGNNSLLSQELGPQPLLVEYPKFIPRVYDDLVQKGIMTVQQKCRPSMATYPIGFGREG